MKWPWSAASKSKERSNQELEKLRAKITKLTEQRNKARLQRDLLKNQVAVMCGQWEAQVAQIRADSQQALGDMEARLATSLAECKEARVLHQAVIQDLEISEKHPVPQDLKWPLPPQDLRWRIGGHRSGRTFINIGQNVANDLQRLIIQAGRDPKEIRSVLDFGCGCGRVLRFLPEVFPTAQLHGADVDSEAVQWCRQNLPFMTGTTALPFHPPVALPDAQFDFIFAISVFTHLPLEVERAWLAELRRLAKPGALLVLTCLPDTAAAEHFTPNLAHEDADGFSYYKTSPIKELPDYYHVSYHSEASVHRLFGEHFQILSISKQGVNNHQDAVICTVPK